jgi:cytochrome c
MKLNRLALASAALALSTLFATPGYTDDAATPAPGPDLKRGKLLFIQCRACHELKEGQPNKVGPNLHGLIGRAAGSVPDFNYTAALKNLHLVWEPKTLDKWIERPSAVAPGTAMAFAGIASPTDRAALIAYLVAETQ